MRTNPVLVLGMGNTLFSDDGAGVRAVRLAASRWKGDGVDFTEMAGGGLDLLDALVGYRAALVVDAAITGQAKPGEVYLLDAEGLPASMAGGAHGAHVGAALAMGRHLRLPVPAHVALMAIEADDITTPGEELTPAVAGAIEPAAEAIASLARELLEEVARDARV